jgi:phosphomannomutase
MIELLRELRKKVVIGFVGGSDFTKISEQLSVGGSNSGFNLSTAIYLLTGYIAVIHDFDYAFAENGLTAYRCGKQLASQSFIAWVGEEKYKKLVNFILHYVADIEIPIKRRVTITFICFITGRALQGDLCGIPQWDDQCQPNWT